MQHALRALPCVFPSKQEVNVMKKFRKDDKWDKFPNLNLTYPWINRTKIQLLLGKKPKLTNKKIGKDKAAIHWNFNLLVHAVFCVQTLQNAWLHYNLCRLCTVVDLRVGCTRYFVIIEQLANKGRKNCDPKNLWETNIRFWISQLS